MAQLLLLLSNKKNKLFQSSVNLKKKEEEEEGKKQISIRNIYLKKHNTTLLERLLCLEVFMNDMYVYTN